MTTDSDLRDLLSSEAAGPPPPAPGWDDVTRRGRHRQRARRTQTAVVGGLAVALAVTAFVLSDQDQELDTTPPATEPNAPRSSLAIPAPAPRGTEIVSARAEGVLLTVILGGHDARGPAPDEPCNGTHPVVIESPGEVVIDVVGASVEEGTPWARCHGRAGMVELTEPLGVRELIDGSHGRVLGPVEVRTSAGMLFPTVLPEPFALEEWDEFGDRAAWTFSWRAGDQYLSVTTAHDGGTVCDPLDVEVRGTSGRLCYDESDGRFELLWEEVGDGSAIAIVGNLGPRPTSETIDDVVAVAEGLVGLENEP